MRCRPYTSPTKESVGLDVRTIANDTGVPTLAMSTCRKHLRNLLLQCGCKQPDLLTSAGLPAQQVSFGASAGRETGRRELSCLTPWFSDDCLHRYSTGSEFAVQAASGLMHLHGREQGVPRPLGLEVASIAAGILGTTGILAGLVARQRGLPVAIVETSVFQAALLFATPYFAVASCEETSRRESSEVGLSGPPFPTGDGHWVELEALTPDSWRLFWLQLGLSTDETARGWLPFVRRYQAAACPLSPGFRNITAKSTFSEIAVAAEQAGVSVCRIRQTREVVAGRDQPTMPWQFLPGQPLPHQETARQPLPPDCLPLTGMRVVEVTRRVQGPLAAMLLAMLGAEVIRIEPPGGDYLRLVPPSAGDAGALFTSLNRGKQVFEINLNSGSGRSDLLQIVNGADVFLHNWRPGRASELGLEFDDVVTYSPQTIYAYAGGWVDKASAPCPIATDYLVQAHAGIGAAMDVSGQSSFPSRVMIVDLLGGLVCCEAVLAALYSRELVPRSWQINTSLFGAAMAAQDHVLRAVPHGRGQARPFNRPRRVKALDAPIATADGFLAISVPNDSTFHLLCGLCDIPRPFTETELIGRFATRSATDWESLLLSEGVSCAVVATDLMSIVATPSFQHHFERAGKALVPTTPWRFIGDD